LLKRVAIQNDLATGLCKRQALDCGNPDGLLRKRSFAQWRSGDNPFEQLPPFTGGVVINGIEQ